MNSSDVQFKDYILCLERICQNIDDEDRVNQYLYSIQGLANVLERKKLTLMAALASDNKANSAAVAAASSPVSSGPRSRKRRRKNEEAPVNEDRVSIGVPLEVILLVCDYVSVRTAVNLGSANKTLQTRLLKNDDFWASLCVRHWGFKEAIRYGGVEFNFDDGFDGLFWKGRLRYFIEKLGTAGNFVRMMECDPRVSRLLITDCNDTGSSATYVVPFNTSVTHLQFGDSNHEEFQIHEHSTLELAKALRKTKMPLQKIHIENGDFETEECFEELIESFRQLPVRELHLSEVTFIYKRSCAVALGQTVDHLLSAGSLETFEFRSSPHDWDEADEEDEDSGSGVPGINAFAPLVSQLGQSMSRNAGASLQTLVLRSGPFNYQGLSVLFQGIGRSKHLKTLEVLVHGDFKDLKPVCEALSASNSLTDCELDFHHQPDANIKPLLTALKSRAAQLERVSIRVCKIVPAYSALCPLARAMAKNENAKELIVSSVRDQFPPLFPLSSGVSSLKKLPSVRFAEAEIKSVGSCFHVIFD